MPSFFNSLAEKAQTAINASPLAQHLPGHGQQQQQYGQGGGSSPSPPGDHTTGPMSQGGGLLNKAGFGGLHNQLRALQAQYSKNDDKQIQLVITAQKSVVLDFDSVGRDAKTYSKELYLWGQEQADDLKDVSDRLAYLNFVQGSLASDLSTKLDGARSSFKTARNAEVALQGRRTQRNAIDTQLNRLHADVENGRSATGSKAKMQELESQKAQLAREGEGPEKEAEQLGRVALRESETAKWAAIREYAEKLILLSQASEALIAEIPANASVPYAGKPRTASVRQTLQQSLDHFKPSTFPSPFSDRPSITPGTVSDVRSFGETHQSELARTPSVLDKQRQDQATLAQHLSSSSSSSSSPSPIFPGSGAGLHPPVATYSNSSKISPTAASGASGGGLNPSSLNNAPAPIPSSRLSPPSTVPPTISTSAASIGSQAPPGPSAFTSDPSSASPTADAGQPTVAETGVPISSGAGGPGPASGSLNPVSRPASGAAGWGGPAAGGVGGFRDPRTGASPASSSGGSRYESAEEEKQRLEREAKERFLRFGSGVGSPSTQPQGQLPVQPQTQQTHSYPTAEDEKRRLERVERERILSTQGGGNQGPSGSRSGNPPQDEEDPNAPKGVPPPYED